MARSLARPTASGVAVRAAGMALGFAVAVFLARTLGAEDLGAYQSTLSICIILASLTAASTERPATRLIAALPADGRQELEREVGLSHLVVGLGVVAIEVVLLAASLAPAIPETARSSLRIAALVVPVLAVLSLRQWIALALRDVAVALGPEQIGLPVAFLALAGLTASVHGLSATAALVAYAGAGALVWTVSSWRLGLFPLIGEGLRPLPSAPIVRERFRDGRPFVLLTVISLLSTYATVPIVAVLAGLDDAGQLAVALQFAFLVLLPLQIVSLTIMPRIARLHRAGDDQGVGTLVRKACTVSLTGGLGLAAVLVLFSDRILGMLGPSFAGTSEILPILVVGQIFSAGLGPNSPTLQMIGQERGAARAESVAMIVRVVAVTATAFTGNIVGVALALTGTNMLRNALLSAELYRRTGILTLPSLPTRHGHPR